MTADAATTEAVEGTAVELAAFLSRCALADVPEPVREHARGLVLDQIGVTLLGSRQRAYAHLRSQIADLGLLGDGPSLVLAAGGRRASPYAATLLNAAASHLSELGEGVSRAVVHVSNATVPVVLAHADRIGATGEDVVRAVALSCEALIRFGLAVNWPPGEPSPTGDIAAAYLAGWWTPTVLSPLGAVTACLLLEGAEPADLLRGWAAAANCAPATSVSFVLGGDPAKGLAMGVGCATGVLAASLRGDGFEDVQHLATGWMPRLVPHVNAAPLGRDLGERWELDYPLYKYMATVGPLHAALEAVFAILDRHVIAPEDVTDVRVESYQRTVQFLGRSRPATAEEAKTSLAHAIGVALVEQRREALLHDAFEPTARTDARIAAVADTVRTERNPVYDAEYPRRSARARVTITLADGRDHVAEIDRDALPRYHRPDHDDLTEKFVGATRHLLVEADARSIAAAAWSLDRNPDARALSHEIGDALAAAAPGG